MGIKRGFVRVIRHYYQETERAAYRPRIPCGYFKDRLLRVLYTLQRMLRSSRDIMEINVASALNAGLTDVESVS